MRDKNGYAVQKRVKTPYCYTVTFEFSKVDIVVALTVI
jgi:hypothetical protein